MTRNHMQRYWAGYFTASACVLVGCGVGLAMGTAGKPVPHPTQTIVITRTVTPPVRLPDAPQAPGKAPGDDGVPPSPHKGSQKR